MGDKNINLSASIKVGRKPKDGKDGTSVTILATKVLYQVSASPTDIPTTWYDDIKNAIQTDSKPYLWSKTIVSYSDNNKTVTYSVSYKGKDGTNGTSFTPKGMADGYYSKATEIPAYSDEQNGKIYIVDDATNVTSPFIVPDAPYVAQYVLHNGEYVLYLVHAEFGDGYNVNGHLYVANDDKWVDFGEIQGAKGEQGDPGIDGKDAINIVFSPAELVFDANENGNLKQSEKSAEIKVYRGTTELNYKTDWDNDAEIGDNCRAALLVNTTTNKPEVKISGITSSMIDDVKVPATSGGAKVSVIIDKVTYRAYLPFSVNVNTYANFLIRDNKKYISKYTEVSNKYDAVSSELNKKADLKTVESTVEQTAENIKLEVLSKTSGRRNMLVNSAFRNQDSVLIHSLARIEKNTGVDGVNCIHSSDTYSGTGDGNYIGAFWDSTQKNGVVTNIPIVKGKKYVISCWIRSDNLDLPFVIECFFMNSINQQNRGEDAVRKEYHVDNVNEWKRIDFVVDTTDTSEYASKVTPYLAVNFWSNNKNVPKAIGADEYPTCNAYICKPMMEEGDTYGGWTLSDGDYDYVGGNMIDNARTLEVGGSLKSINENNVADYGLAYYGDSMSLRINNTNSDSTPSIMMFQPSLEVGVDYMFSFLAKGTANIGLYALCDNSVDGDYLLSEDSVNADVRIVDTFRNRYASIILIPTQLTTEYKRYWGHMRFYGHVPTKLYLQLNHAGEVYISQPKLEIGATMTEFTERKTDLVDKASLKKAGIEITANQVKLYGDKVQVLTRIDGTPEYEEAGMFTNGKFNAKYIDAENIVVNGLQGKTIDAKKATITNLNVSNVKLTGTLRSPFTKANDSFDIGYSDNAAMPVEGGGWKTDYNLPWNVEQSGRRICLTNNLWDGETVFGTVSIDVPDKAKEYGCRFYENGIAKTELCFSSELIELMAYGNISAKNDNEPKSQYIYGWVVLNRVSLVPSRSKFGRQKKVLAYGKVEGTPTAAYIKYKTFDGSQDIRVTRNYVGTYVIYIPDNGWFSDKDDIFINLTGVGHCYDKNNVGSSPAKATVLDITEVSSTYGGGFNIAIEVSDDETPNDGSFNFELSNFSDFDY
nr:MAG TPA: hypothetical protein [Caudoviricetes sp.]